MNDCSDQRSSCSDRLVRSMKASSTTNMSRAPTAISLHLEMPARTCLFGNSRLVEANLLRDAVVRRRGFGLFGGARLVASRLARSVFSNVQQNDLRERRNASCRKFTRSAVGAASLFESCHW